MLLITNSNIPSRSMSFTLVDGSRTVKFRFADYYIDVGMNQSEVM